jgi:glycosyltransferase involved in cell wall biosynthesis
MTHRQDHSPDMRHALLGPLLRQRVSARLTVAPALAASAEPDRGQIREEDQMRCLWLTRVDPVAPDAGDLSYSFHLLSSLRRTGVDLTVLAVARAGDCTCRPLADGIEWILVAPEDNEDLRGRVAIRSLFSRLPNVAARFRTAAFQRELRTQLKREWDAIVVDHLGMGWAWPWVKAYQRRNPGAILVFIAHQCEGDVRRSVARNFTGNMLRKIGLYMDSFKAGRLEREMVRHSTLFSTITAEDRDHFDNFEKSVLITPGYAGVHDGFRDITADTPRRVLIFGSAVWLAKQMNLIEFLTASDELLWQNQIQLWVVGKIPDQLRTTNNYRATRFLGFVDDPKPIFRSVRIGIVAERTGGGFKLKSLDYVFSRVPIAAIRGGIAGLPLTPEVDYLSFESLRELALGITAAIDDFKLLNRLQEAAYTKCSSGFDWADRGRTLSESMQQAIGLETLR